jgi:protein disulfide-isomerase A1
MMVNLKIQSLILILSLSAILCQNKISNPNNSTELEMVDNILILNSYNFDNATAIHPIMLVEFFSNNCTFCKKLEPEFIKAAEIVRERGIPVVFGKVDGPNNPLLTIKHSIQGYPTIKLYKNSKWTEYTDKRTSEDIINFVERKSGPSALFLEKVIEVETQISKNKFSLLSFVGKDRSQLQSYKLFEHLSDILNNINYLICPSEECIEKYQGASNVLLLFTHFNTSPIRIRVQPSEGIEFLRNEVEKNTIPLFDKFEDEHADYIFGREKVGLILFEKTNDTLNNVNYRNYIREIAPKYRNIVFTYSGIKGDLEERLAEYYDIKEDMLPLIKITDVKSDEDIRIYTYNHTEITQENIIQFVEDFLAGRLKKQLKSEEIPNETYENGVYKIVSKTWDHVMKNIPRHFLVWFSDLSHTEDKIFRLVYEELARLYATQSDIIIARIDMSKNELEDEVIEKFPHVRLYLKDIKAQGFSMHYSGDNSLQDLRKFLNEALSPDYPDDGPVPEVKKEWKEVEYNKREL